MINEQWVRTTHEVYMAIYKQHEDQLELFGTYTRIDGDAMGPGKRIRTAWGFKGADCALIRSECENPTPKTSEDEWRYYIAAPREFCDDD